MEGPLEEANLVQADSTRLDSGHSRPNRPQINGKHVLKCLDTSNRAFQIGPPPQYQNLLLILDSCGVI